MSNIVLGIFFFINKENQQKSSGEDRKQQTSKTCSISEGDNIQKKKKVNKGNLGSAR